MHNLCFNELMDFARYVEGFQSLYLNAKNVSEPRLSALSEIISFHPRKILLVAPHPDDECLMGGFALRAKEEFGSAVKVVPYSYGSKKERRADRKAELRNAVDHLGFELVDPRIKNSTSLDEISADELMSVFMKEHPDVIITAHLDDGHSTHIRSSETADLVIGEWVKKTKVSVHWLQSEYWHSMHHPNLLVPLTSAHLTRMGEALLKHVGEVSRNPYHLTLPAWSMDQLRRGSEMLESLSGKTLAGDKVKEGVFAQIYRIETINP
jgi:LmbE family N-acetylglucosaminyl deacetylase